MACEACSGVQGIAWGITGAAMECYETALQYGLQRRIFGRAVAATQLYQVKLADMASRIVGSQLMSLHFGRLKDMDQLSPLQARHFALHEALGNLDLCVPAVHVTFSKAYSWHCLS